MEYIIWVILSLLFYVVCYMAVLNLIDEKTKNSIFKFPAMMAASFPSAFLMAIFDYQPIFLFALISFTNHYRIKEILNQETTPEKMKGLNLNPVLFYSSSYSYIVLMCILTYYFQMPITKGDIEAPLWKTWFPETSVVR
tara:strand:- start:452 stop:868 length:417 start_codon:yes stop_codon:yes gene_type:complete